ncbi:ATP-dependent RNA helicase, partial [Testudinibacter sp. TR-2022]
RADGVEVKHIVGAIANEGDIDSRYIGHIKLHDDYSTIELPKDMPKELLQHFGKTRVLNKPMQMRFVEEVKGDGGFGRGERKGGFARGKREGGFRDGGRSDFRGGRGNDRFQDRNERGGKPSFDRKPRRTGRREG